MLVVLEGFFRVYLGIYFILMCIVIDREGQVAYLEPGVSTAETLRRVLYEAGVEHPATA